MRVGLFDSGIGGLTVLRTLMKKYPNNDYIYYGDTLNVPYGNKTIEELNELSKKDVEYLINKNVDIIIVACGTVSSNCLDYLKETFDIPIYGVVMPTIEYINNSDYKNIGVLATNATINSHIFKNNINKNVYEIPAPILVDLIEKNETSYIEEVLHEYLDKYKDKIDALILGCTHYPLIKDYLKHVIDVDIIEMGDYIEVEEGSSKSLDINFSRTDKVIDSNIDIILNS